jgi:hypothetical protein
MSNTTVPIQPIAKGSMLKLWGGLGVLALGAIGLAYVGAGKAPPGACMASSRAQSKSISARTPA